MPADHPSRDPPPAAADRPTARRSGRGLLLRLGAASAAVAVALLAAEGALRALDRARPEPRHHAGERASRPSENFVPDADTGWRMRPGRAFEWVTDGRSVRYRADLEGFRVAEDGAAPGEGPESRPPDGSPTGDLAVCGDSFAFGTGVTFEETFGARIAAGLALRPRLYAMPGFGVDQVWRSVVGQALPARPARLLVAVYPEDFDRSFTAYRVKEGFAKPRYELVDGVLRPQSPGDAPPRIWSWVEERSRVLAALRIVERRVGREHGRLGWWRLNEAMLDAILAAARRADVDVTVLLVPSRLWRPFPALRRWASDRGARLLDPVADSDLRPDGLYYARDSHLNAAGHAALAAWCLERLRASAADVDSPPR